jgi:hypothetical protein
MPLSLTIFMRALLQFAESLQFSADGEAITDSFFLKSCLALSLICGAALNLLR